MTPFDLVIPAFIILGTIIGWKKGFVETVCSFAGFFIGLIVAYMLYNVVGAWLAPTLGGNFSIASLIAFVLIWIACPLALGVVGNMLTHILKVLPVIGKVNSLAGALIGFIKYFLLTVCVVNALIFAGIISQENVDNSFCVELMKVFFESFVDAYKNAA